MAEQVKTIRAKYNLADYIYSRIRDLSDRERVRLCRILADRMPEFIDDCIADARTPTKNEKNNHKGDKGD